MPNKAKHTKAADKDAKVEPAATKDKTPAKPGKEATPDAAKVADSSKGKGKGGGKKK